MCSVHVCVCVVFVCVCVRVVFISVCVCVFLRSCVCGGGGGCNKEKIKAFCLFCFIRLCILAPFRNDGSHLLSLVHFLVFLKIDGFGERHG